MIDNQILTYVEGRLDVAARRQQTFATNIANLDTPGYKAKQIEFSEALSGATTTRVVEAEGKLKENGNNVDLENEMTEMTKNGFQYMTLIQYLNQKMKTLRSSISESRG